MLAELKSTGLRASECERRDDSLGCFSFPVLGILLLLKLKHSLKGREECQKKGTNKKGGPSALSENTHKRKKNLIKTNKQCLISITGPNIYHSNVLHFVFY